MTANKRLVVIFTLASLGSLLMSCGTGQTTASGCGYPAEITIGSSTKMLPSGSCAEHFVSQVAIHISVGQTLTVHFASRGMNFAKSLHPRVLEFIAKNSMEQRFRAVVPGSSQILYSAPSRAFSFCSNGETVFTPCVIANVTVT